MNIWNNTYTKKKEKIKRNIKNKSKRLMKTIEHNSTYTEVISKI